MSSPARSPTDRRVDLRAAIAALAGVFALAFAGAGCGNEETAAEVGAGSTGEPQGVVDISGTEPVGEMLAGSVAPMVQCRDWNGATAEQKLATIEDVRSQINLQDSGIEMPALTDEEALEMFDGSCRPSWAQGFRLYKLYARAAGWVTMKRMLEEERALEEG